MSTDLSFKFSMCLPENNLPYFPRRLVDADALYLRIVFSNIGTCINSLALYTIPLIAWYASCMSVN